MLTTNHDTLAVLFELDALLKFFSLSNKADIKKEKFLKPGASFDEKFSGICRSEELLSLVSQKHAFLKDIKVICEKIKECIKLKNRDADEKPSYESRGTIKEASAKLFRVVDRTGLKENILVMKGDRVVRCKFDTMAMAKIMNSMVRDRYKGSINTKSDCDYLGFYKCFSEKDRRKTFYVLIGKNNYCGSGEDNLCVFNIKSI